MKLTFTTLLVCAIALAAVAATPASRGVWLDVPFVHQEKNGCGAAAISMVMQYWERTSGRSVGTAADPRVILDALYKRRARGIYAADMEQYFREHGFDAYAFHGTWADLEHHLAEGRALIVSLKTGRSRGSLHYVVVAGVSENAVMVNDSARRRLLTLDRSSFEKSWKATGNWTLLAVPH